MCLGSLTLRLHLKPRVDGFTFESQHGKRAFVNSPERLAANEALQAFYPERELA